MLTTDLLRCCFYPMYSLLAITTSVVSGQELYFILGLSKIRVNKQTEISLAYRILRKFINQPTGFVGARQCSTSSLIPRSTHILIKAPSKLPNTALHKATYCHKNVYHMMETNNFYQKTCERMVNK